MQEDLSLNTTVSSLGNAFARSKVVGSLLRKKPDILNAAAYVTTPLVARDMLSIVKAHGREKLQYWGFSFVLWLSAFGFYLIRLLGTVRFWERRQYNMNYMKCDNNTNNKEYFRFAAMFPVRLKTLSNSMLYIKSFTG